MPKRQVRWNACVRPVIVIAAAVISGCVSVPHSRHPCDPCDIVRQKPSDPDSTIYPSLIERGRQIRQYRECYDKHE